MNKYFAFGRCPYCESTDIDEYDIDEDFPYEKRSKVACLECDRMWYIVYKPNHIEYNTEINT